MPKATAALSDDLCPAIGRPRTASHKSRIPGSMPAFSLPTIRAILAGESGTGGVEGSAVVRRSSAHSR